MKTPKNLLARFSESLSASEEIILQDVAEYLRWESETGGGEFQPQNISETDILTYILHCQTSSHPPLPVRRIRRSLFRFFAWMKAQGLIDENPFKNIHQLSAIPRKAVRTRHQAFQGSQEQKEIARLKALNHLAESTNKSVSVETMLQAALHSMMDGIDLHTAWITLSSECKLIQEDGREKPEHGFQLAGAINLPAALDANDQHFMRKAPACSCQTLLRSGKLKRGVNIVECSRLKEALAAGGESSDFKFHASVPISMNGKLIGLMNFAAAEWQLLSASDLEFLTAGARQVGAALERASLHDQIQLHRDHMARELVMARRMQVSMMPEKLPEIKGYELAAIWKPAYETGGDFYNVYKLPGGRWGFLIADVCDKGAQAALYMAMAHGLIREIVENESSPANMLTRVNRSLLRQGLSKQFVTVFYGILEPSEGIMTYSLAGHPAPLIKDAKGNVLEMDGGGVALGIFSDARFTDGVTKLKKGDTLVAYTDGITDASNSIQGAYRLEQLTSTLKKSPAKAVELAKTLQAGLDEWVGDAPVVDDITMLVISRH